MPKKSLKRCLVNVNCKDRETGKSERELRLIKRKSKSQFNSEQLESLIDNLKNINISISPTSKMAEELKRYTAEYESLKEKIDPIMVTIETLVEDDSEVRPVKRNKIKLDGYAEKLSEVDLKIKDLEIRAATQSPSILNDISKLKENIFELGLNTKCSIQEAEDFISSESVDIKPGFLLGQVNNHNLVKLEAMKLPEFNGDIKHYEKWKQITQELLPESMSEGLKITRVLGVLKGEAQDYVGNIGKHLETWDAFWSYLDDKYLDKWANCYEIIGEMLEIQPAQIDDKALTDLGNKFGQILQAILATKMDAEEIMTTWFFHIIPKELRSKMLNALKTRMPQAKSYHWTQINKIWNEQLSVLPKENTSENILNTLSYKSNATNYQNINKDSHLYKQNTHNLGNNNQFRQLSESYCAFCEDTSHKINKCTKYVTKEEQNMALKNNKMCMICARKNVRGVHSCTGYCKCGCEESWWRCKNKNKS